MFGTGSAVAVDERELDAKLKHLEGLEQQNDAAELYKQVGRVVVTLSNIENLMAMVFVIVSHNLTTEEASAIFDSYQSFDQKFKLVGYAIQQNDLGNEHEEWEKLSKRLQGQKLVRNLVAHQRMQFKQTDGGKHKPVLTAHWFKKTGRRKRDLETLNVKAAGDELEAIHADMWEFIRGLSPVPGQSSPDVKR